MYTFFLHNNYISVSSTEKLDGLFMLDVLYYVAIVKT